MGVWFFNDTPFNNSELIKDAFYSIGKPSLSKVIIVQNFETHEQFKGILSIGNSSYL